RQIKSEHIVLFKLRERQIYQVGLNLWLNHFQSFQCYAIELNGDPLSRMCCRHNQWLHIDLQSCGRDLVQMKTNRGVRTIGPTIWRTCRSKTVPEKLVCRLRGKVYALAHRVERKLR